MHDRQFAALCIIGVLCEFSVLSCRSMLANTKVQLGDAQSQLKGSNFSERAAEESFKAILGAKLREPNELGEFVQGLRALEKQLNSEGRSTWMTAERGVRNLLDSMGLSDHVGQIRGSCIALADTVVRQIDNPTEDSLSTEAFEVLQSFSLCPRHVFVALQKWMREKDSFEILCTHVDEMITALQKGEIGHFAMKLHGIRDEILPGCHEFSHPKDLTNLMEAIEFEVEENESFDFRRLLYKIKWLIKMLRSHAERQEVKRKITELLDSSYCRQRLQAQLEEIISLIWSKQIDGARHRMSQIRAQIDENQNMSNAELFRFIYFKAARMGDSTAVTAARAYTISSRINFLMPSRHLSLRFHCGVGKSDPYTSDPKMRTLLQQWLKEKVNGEALRSLLWKIGQDLSSNNVHVARVELQFLFNDVIGKQAKPTTLNIIRLMKAIKAEDSNSTINPQQKRMEGILKWLHKLRKAECVASN